MSERALRPAEAWFIPGARTERWIAELIRCGMAEVNTQLYVVPTAHSDGGSAGVLVVPGPGFRLLASPSGFACSWIGRKLCIPTDAELSPPLSPAEADALCEGAIVFFHPTQGVSRFHPTQSLEVAQLLTSPPTTVAEWSRARPGSRLHGELTHITLLSPPRLQDLFGDAADVIGTRPAHELPPGPEELSTEGRSFAEQLKDLLAQGIQGVASQLPEKSLAKDWVNPLSQWATRHFTEEQRHLQKERDRELHRLLTQLEQDPDAGLRHAIPLAHLPHRGRAQPESRLGARSTEFDPTKLGGGPADFWEAPADLQARLRRAYRELANRELILSNFRRAAYIFAHLLGDLASAADALKQGKHYREAALLYDERLHNPSAAAHCLEQGELLQEALELYRRIGAKADVARVHEKRGDQTSAREIWREMVADHRSVQDHLEAARLLDEKLDSMKEAAAELQAGWPDSPQAIPCLHALLELWSRHGHHEESIGFLRRMEQARGAFWKQDGFLEILIQQARKHPDPQVRRETANLCLIAISRRLQEPRVALRTLSRLTGYLSELTPNDRLLYRDANRYVNRRRHPVNVASKANFNAQPASLSATAARARSHPEDIVLPSGIRWFSFKPIRSGFVGLGTKDSLHLVMIRASWSGMVQTLEIPGSLTRDASELLFEPITPERPAVLFRPSADQTVPPTRFPVVFPDFPEPAEVSTPDWLGSRGHPLCCTSEGVWSMDLNASAATVFYHQLDGTLLSTWDVGDLLRAAGASKAPLKGSIAAGRNMAAVSLDRHLLILGQEGTWEARELPMSIHRLLVDDSGGQSLIVAVLEQGVFYYLPGPPVRCGSLDDNTQEPLVTSLGRGIILIQEGEEGRLLRVSAEGPGQLMQWTTTDRKIVAALPLGARGEFVLLDQDGLITRHRMPRARP